MGNVNTRGIKYEKIWILFSICVLSFLAPGCGTSDNPSDKPSTGIFKATMGDRKYELDVTCDTFQKDRVMFRSDDSGYAEAKDTNGDNIAVTGSPGLGEGLSLALVINDNGEVYVVNSSIQGQKLDLEMNGNTLTGRGKMLGIMGQPTIEFTLTCK